MKLFQESTYIPFTKSTNYIDNLLSSNEYEKIYIDFEKCIVEINKKLDKIFFKKKFNYASKYFVVIEPHLVAFNLLTKAIIIDKIISRKKLNKIIVEIYDEELSKDYYYRFINLYELIVRKIGHPFKIINKGKANIHYRNDPSSKSKFLNLFNFNYKILAYEILKRNLKFNSKKKILKIGQNYITREIEFELFKCGIGTLPVKNELRTIYDNLLSDSHTYGKYETIYKIVKMELDKLKYKFFNNTKVYNAYTCVLSDIINSNIVDLFSKKDLMRKKIYDYKKQINFNLCLSNGLFGLFGKSTYDALSYNGIEVISAEHGLTVGNSRDSLQYFFANESLTSNRLLCYSKASKITHKKNKNSNLKLDVVGAPQFPKILKYRSFKKFVLKKKFNLSGINVFYISHNIELNPGKYFPYTKTNPEIFNDELSLLSTLGKINKNVIYKSYPTMQYLMDKNEILNNYIKKFENIKIFKGEEDFRYVRSIADIIITQSSESTLEWCIGANVPLIFLDSDFYEPLENENVKKAFKDSFFFFNYDKVGWKKQLTDFLNLPYEDILRKWNEKEIYRKNYDDKYFLSSKKYAGSIGSKLILNLIDGN